LYEGRPFVDPRGFCSAHNAPAATILVTQPGVIMRHQHSASGRAHGAATTTRALEEGAAAALRCGPCGEPSQNRKHKNPCGGKAKAIAAAIRHVLQGGKFHHPSRHRRLTTLDVAQGFRQKNHPAQRSKQHIARVRHA